jgi:hypothetical protein
MMYLISECLKKEPEARPLITPVITEILFQYVSALLAEKKEKDALCLIKKPGFDPKVLDGDTGETILH